MRQTRSLVLVLVLARRDRGPAPAGASSADPGVTPTTILLGGTTPLSGAGVRLRVGRPRSGRVLPVREHARRRQRPHDHLQVPRRRLQPGADGARRRASSSSRTRSSRSSTRSARSRTWPIRDYLNAAKVPQLFVASGATTFGRDCSAVPVHDRLPAELPGRGLDLRQVSRPHAARARRSRCSSRTTATGRTCSGPQAGLARSKAKVVAAQNSR